MFELTCARQEIEGPESLSLALSQSATLAARGVHSAFDLVVMPTAGSVVLSDADSLFLQLDKSETRVRGKLRIDLQLALSGDTFSLDLGEDTNASRLLIEGMTSLQAGVHGWNNIVRRTMSYAALRRVDDTHLVISIPQVSFLSTALPHAPGLLFAVARLGPLDRMFACLGSYQSADYDITAPETIVLSLPGAAFASAASPSLVAAGPAGHFVINASQGSSALSGTLLADANVASIQSPVENTITVTLADVDFADALFTSTAMQTALARSLATRDEAGDSNALYNAEAYGWNAIVRPGLSYEHVQFVAGTRQSVGIRIPQFAAYQVPRSPASQGLNTRTAGLTRALGALCRYRLQRS